MRRPDRALIPVTPGGAIIDCVEAAGREGAREALLDAGLQLWHDGGWPAVTLEDAADRAGVTVAGFRDEFPAPSELTCAIFDGIVDERSAAMISAMAAAPPSPAPRMRALIEAMLDDVARDPRRAVVLGEPIGSPALLVRRRSANRGFAEMVVDGNRGTRIEPDQLRAAGHFALGGLGELVFAWLDPASPVERALVVEHGVRLFEASVKAFG